MRKLAVTSLLAALVATGGALAQTLPTVPRNRTLITQGWDLYNQVPAPENVSPYNGSLLHQRNILHYTVNEMLFYTNANNNEVIPWQATGWKYGPDFRTVTITLRDGVKWSDGENFTADDVVFTFDMLRDSAPDVVFSSAIKEWVASAEAPDPHTVIIHLTKPGPRWAEDFLATGQTTRFVVVPKHIWQAKDPRSFGDFDLAKGWPIGTGPYRLVKSDSGSMVFDRQPHWWAVDSGFVKSMPAPERIVYHPATAEAMPQLFTGNDIDMGRSLQVGAFEAARARNPNLASWNSKGPIWGVADGCLLALAFNVQTPPYDVPEVRQAIAAVIDRDQIAELSFEGAVPIALGPFSSLASLQAYTKQMSDLLGTGKPDRALADKLLTSKGFKRGAGGKWVLPDGKPWPITIISQLSDPIAPVLARQLQEAGFDAVFRGSQDSAYFDALLSGGYGTAIYDHCGSLYDPWQTLDHYNGKYAAPAGQKVPGVRTITRYSNPEYDAIINQMEARQPSPQDADYMALVRKATAIVMRDRPDITLTEEVQTVTFNTTYWTGWPNAADPYMAAFQAWEGFALVIDRLQPRK